MTTQELKQEFRQALAATVALAQASDLRGDVVGYHLRSLANNVSHKWNAELDRRNAQRRMAAAE